MKIYFIILFFLFCFFTVSIFLLLSLVCRRCVIIRQIFFDPYEIQRGTFFLFRVLYQIFFLVKTYPLVQLISRSKHFVICFLLLPFRTSDDGVTDWKTIGAYNNLFNTIFHFPIIRN